MTDFRPGLFPPGALVWYHQRWVEARHVLRIPGTVISDSGYWCRVVLLLRDGSTPTRRVRSQSLTTRAPEDPFD